MRFMKRLLLFIIVIGTGYYIVTQTTMIPPTLIDRVKDKTLELMDMNELKKHFQEEENDLPEKEVEKLAIQEDLFSWIGKDPAALEKELGEAVRKDLSPYGYTWWVYTNHTSEYIQFGIANNEIQTIYVAGDDLYLETLEVGQSYASVAEHYSFAHEVRYEKGASFYTFHLTEEDLMRRPLVKLADDLFLQFYFDTYTNTLSSVRIATVDTLLSQLSYEIEYRGELPTEPELSTQEWEKVDRGMEQQVFDITNIMRYRFDKPSLKWEEDIQQVAFMHSKDMADQDYFSHESLDGRGLKERLAEKDVEYQAAGENIASQYPDAPDAMEGWLNSEGHRNVLLDEQFTHLGVGVYRLYFTQNFSRFP